MASSLFDAGGVARVCGGFGQGVGIGLRVVEGDDGFPFSKLTSAFSTPATLDRAFLTVIGHASQVMPGTDKVTVLAAAQAGNSGWWPTREG